MKTRIGWAAMGWVLAARVFAGQAPAVINYQGRLMNGTNLYNGNVALSLQLWTAASGGVRLYEDSNTVAVVDGLYSTLLGDDTTSAFPLEDALALAGTNAHVQVLVNGTALTPRERLASVGYAVVPGLKGFHNVESGAWAACGGGRDNTAAGDQSVVAGGTNNAATSPQAVVSGGLGNSATGWCAVVGGGRLNTAGADSATVAGGRNNQALGTYAAIPGGRFNRASGAYSLAAGRQALADHDGAFVWSDSIAVDFASTASNQFIVRAGGGIGLGTAAPRQQVSVGDSLDLYSGAANSPAQASIRASSLGHLFLNARTGGHLYLNADTGSNVLINPNGGFVGIGTNQPNAALAVNGEVRITQAAYAESFVGDGSGLTALQGANIAAGTVSNLQLAAASVTADKLAESYWKTTGNAGTVAGTHYLGTTDDQPMEIHCNGARVMLYIRNYATPCLVGGSGANTISTSVFGSVISGGGASLAPNAIAANYAAIGGGMNNLIEGSVGAIAGGNSNKVSERNGFVGGGERNVVSGPAAAIAGGYSNRVTAESGFIGGGQHNEVMGTNAVVAGGGRNNAQGVCSTVSGGASQQAAGDYSTVSGGRAGTANGTYSAVAGGYANAAGGYEAFVGGGVSNRAESVASVIAGGQNNAVHLFALHAAIGGGQDNAAGADATHAAIGGGATNTIRNGAFGFIGGGRANLVDYGNGGVIAGGESNLCAGVHANVAGGLRNTISAPFRAASVGGGERNALSANHAVIAGGCANKLYDGDGGFIGGGSNNMVRSLFTSVVGGRDNLASGEVAVVCGGLQNQAQGFASYLGGGQDNRATNDMAVVGGGWSNKAAGVYSVVPGGRDNEAHGRYGLAAGRRAKALHNGTFAWADSTDADLATTAQNQFMIRASGGAVFYSDAAMSAGVQLAAGAGAWTTLSDREAKEDFRAVDGREVLERLSAVPIATWKYKAQEAAIRHIGPVAQDFHAAFGVGETPTGITTVDADGVALAAIQGLYDLVRQENARLQRENEALRERLESIENRLAAAESLVHH